MTVFDGRLAGALRGEQPLLGIFTSISSPALVEMCGHARFDFVVLDNEHGPAGIETTEHLIRAAKGAGIPPIVRVSGAIQQEILRTLDIGASGIQVPQVNTVEQARLVVASAKYPPEGARGSAFGTRAAGFGFFGGAAYMEAANRETVIITHIETVEAVRNLDAMLAVAGIDVFFIGPNDLSVSMGYPGNQAHPDVQATIRDCIKRIRDASKVAGLMLSTNEQFATFADLGARYMTVSITNLVVGALKKVVGDTKGRT